MEIVVTHYNSRAEALGNYHSLKVGDTFTSDEKCPGCEFNFKGFYSASATFEINRNHSCIKELMIKIKELEKVVDRIEGYIR